MLHLEIVFGLAASGDESPAILSLLVIEDVVAGALLGIAQHGVCFVDFAEAILVTRLAVIGVKALREQAVDTVDRVGLSVGAHLQHLIEVDCPLCQKSLLRGSV